MKKSKVNPIWTEVTFCVEQLVKEAKEERETVYLDFNGIRIEATPECEESDVLAKYFADTKKAKEAYISSPEFKAMEEASKADIESKNEKISELVVQLYDIDSTDQRALLSWVIEFQPTVDRVGVDTPVKEILQIFENKGYLPNVNIGDDFDEEDSDNFARYIIGQVMNQLEEMHSIHSSLASFSHAWKNKFDFI